MKAIEREGCPADPEDTIRQLDPDVIRQRLADIERERQALLVLLRASIRAHGYKKGES